jgi:hypothetical protein
MTTDDNNKVGYRTPPTHSRWKTGQCGNPRGRRKGALNFNTELKLMLEAPITVNDKGKPKRMTTLKAVFWRAREKALKGDDRALRTVLEYAARMLGGSVANDVGECSADDQAILAAYREEIRRETAETNKSSSTGDCEDEESK